MEKAVGHQAGGVAGIEGHGRAKLSQAPGRQSTMEVEGGQLDVDARRRPALEPCSPLVGMPLEVASDDHVQACLQGRRLDTAGEGA